MRWIIGLFALALAGAAQAAAPPACDRACLKGFADGYLTALVAKDPSKLPVAANVKVTENGHLSKLGEGVWKVAGPIGAYRLELYDPQQGTIGLYTSMQEQAGLALYVSRLKVENGRITEVETLVARKGSYGNLWSPENLKAVSPNFSRTIRKAEQNSRLELMAAGDAYFRAFSTNGTPDYHPAPLMPGTERFENGVQTTNVGRNGNPGSTAMEQFDSGRFKGFTFNNLRYPVVDEERGVVMMILQFGPRPDMPNRPGTKDIALVMEAFAVQYGKIVEVQVELIQQPPGGPMGW
jgi:hypothetical protein